MPISLVEMALQESGPCGCDLDPSSTFNTMFVSVKRADRVSQGQDLVHAGVLH